MLLASPNKPVPLHAIAADGAPGLYCRANVFDHLGQSVISVNLSYASNGLYVGTYTPTSVGIYTVIYSMYTDQEMTQSAGYDNEAETIDVNDDRSNIARLLGLMYENSVFDQQVYNAQNNVVSGRIRAYDSRANAELAGRRGLLYTWSVNAVYNLNGQLTNFIIKRAD